MENVQSSCRQWNQWPKEIDQVDIPALRADLKKIRELWEKSFCGFQSRHAIV